MARIKSRCGITEISLSRQHLNPLGYLSVPVSALIRFENGGHLSIGTEHVAIRTTVARYVPDHAEVTRSQ